MFVISCITSYVKAWVLSETIHVDYDCSNIEEKNGDITSKSNYRPIALATVCPKIIEIFIVKQMSDHLWTTDNQFAYKKGHSTEICIFLLKECIRY